MSRRSAAVRGNRIVRVGDVGRTAARVELDVTGRLVAPGFINVHRHADTRALGTAANLLTQGVTTVRRIDAQRFVRSYRQLRNETLTGI